MRLGLRADAGRVREHNQHDQDSGEESQLLRVRQTGEMGDILSIFKNNFKQIERMLTVISLIIALIIDYACKPIPSTIRRARSRSTFLPGRRTVVS